MKTMNMNLNRALNLGALALALTSTSLTAQMLGSRNTFDNALVLSQDVILTSPSDALAMPDGASGLKQMGFNDFQIQTLREQAEEWFFERYGYDFSQVRVDANGLKIANGIMEAPFHVPDGMYRAILLKDGLKKNLEIQDAGIGFVVVGEGVKWMGTYGGEMGTEAMMQESVFMGYYAIPGAGKDGGRVRLKYRADAPMQMTMSGDMTVRCSIESEEWGDGYELGLIATKMTMDGRYHMLLRNVMTFPDSTLGDMDMPMMPMGASKAKAKKSVQ